MTVTPVPRCHTPLGGGTTGTDTLRELLNPPRWHRDAQCLEHPDVEFFPGKGEPTEPAKAICSTCLVRTECAAYAITNGIVDGIWGGLTGRDRRRIRSAAKGTAS